MPNEYKSMREIGKHFGATSHEVGRWLQNLGLRDENKEPTPRADDEEWIAKLPSRQLGKPAYRVRPCNGIGQEIVDESTGLTVAWTTSPELAHRIVRLLNEDG